MKRLLAVLLGVAVGVAVSWFYRGQVQQLRRLATNKYSFYRMQYQMAKLEGEMEKYIHPTFDITGFEAQPTMFGRMLIVYVTNHQDWDDLPKEERAKATRAMFFIVLKGTANATDEVDVVALVGSFDGYGASSSGRRVPMARRALAIICDRDDIIAWRDTRDPTKANDPDIDPAYIGCTVLPASGVVDSPYALRFAGRRSALLDVIIMAWRYEVLGYDD